MSKIRIIKRDDITFDCEFKNGCVAVDLTGATVFFTVKTLANADSLDTSAVISKTITSHYDPTNGKTRIELSSTDTDITAGNYWFDIQLKDTANKISSCEKGQIEVLQDITRRTS
jgi:hypothetical protein